tara:strand:+ start:118 stop:543 length:426 start_codon:yes stop_codon:yes gene_type:complete
MMKEILTALMIWLGANTTFDTNHDIPNVLFLTQTQMEELYYPEDQDKFPNQLHGLYDKESDTIILPETWDRRKPWDMGVLLHEMVHYLQDINGLEFQCLAEMEKDAWPIQQKYLKERHNFEWNYDGLWYLVISTCADPFNY